LNRFFSIVGRPVGVQRNQEKESIVGTTLGICVSNSIQYLVDSTADEQGQPYLPLVTETISNVDILHSNQMRRAVVLVASVSRKPGISSISSSLDHPCRKMHTSGEVNSLDVHCIYNLLRLCAILRGSLLQQLCVSRKGTN
jgi:hypothetical protein